MTRPAYALDGVDTDALLERTGSVQERTVRVVGGVGDVALALVAAGARVRLEVNAPGAWALAHARVAALRELPVASTRSYLGLAHFGRRVWFHHYLRGAMDPEARAWLDAREHLVREGLAACGTWEQAATGRALVTLARRAQAGSVPARWALTRVLAARWGARSITAAHVTACLRAPNGAHARRLLGIGTPEDVPAWLRPDLYASVRAALHAGALTIARDAVPSGAETTVLDADTPAPPGDAPRVVRLSWDGGTPLGGTVRGHLASSPRVC